jgi:hypothetical protein
MKKIYALFFLFTFFGLTGSGQSPRLVLLEEFTSSTCGPCATYNPTIIQRLQQYPDQFTAIFYHVGWPAPGNDPMYLHNQLDNNARVSYYGVNTVPRSVLDGNYYNGHPNGWNMTTITNRQAVPSPFTLQLQHELSPSQDTFFITMIAVASQNITGQLVAHNAVIEKHIHFTSPPGNNGETDFYNVLKKLLPSKSGFTLPASMQDGDYVIIESYWVHENVYDVDELATVGFIQDNADKEVQQAINSTTDTPVMPYDDDVEMFDIAQIPSANCSGKVTPKITVRNNGNNTVTSFTLKYKINENTLETYTWNGSIGVLDKAVIMLPEYSFTPLASNTFKIYSENPNNVSDEYPKNDTLTYTFTSAKTSSLTLYLYLRTDENPQQSAWDVKNAAGTVIQSGGPYAEASTLYRDTIYIPQTGCYLFTVYDSGGDGICCSNTMYKLFDDDGVVIKEGGLFKYNDMVEFDAVATGFNKRVGNPVSLRVVPNPVYGISSAIFTLEHSGTVGITLFNTLGIPVKTWDLGNLLQGTHTVPVDGSSLNPGIYLLRLKTGTSVMVEKVVVE